MARVLVTTTPSGLNKPAGMQWLAADHAQKGPFGSCEVVRIEHVHVDLFVAYAAERDRDAQGKAEAARRQST